MANLRHLPDQLPSIVLEATRKLQDPLLEGLLQHYVEFIAFAHGGDGSESAPSPSELLPLISEVRSATMFGTVTGRLKALAQLKFFYKHLMFISLADSFDFFYSFPINGFPSIEIWLARCEQVPHSLRSILRGASCSAIQITETRSKNLFVRGLLPRTPASTLPQGVQKPRTLSTL